MHRLAPLLLACACSKPVGTKPTPPATTTATAITPSKPSAACTSAEHRQFDFWIGTWDVRIRARSAPDKDEWGEANGTQTIESILGSCAIAEHFSAEGPQQPWAGKSYSMWQSKLGKWRQTWVDDSGNFIALTGGVEAGVMTLYGEPRTVADKTIQMRMVFKDVTRDSLLWEWQRTDDNWTTSIVMMSIVYRRRS